MSISVVGFDIGNETSYIAVAKGGGIETIDRCTPTYVSFGDRSRFMGASAKQQAITNIKNTIFNFPRLIGKKFFDPAVQREIPFLPYNLVSLENDTIGIKCQYRSEMTIFSPEQIMAAQMTKLKEITELHLQSPCVDVVLNVPAYYTDSERRAMLDASSIASLKCVRLLNDTTACVIAYGLYNKDFPPVEAPPKIVAFVMLGQSNLQVTICAFNNGEVKLLSVSCDPNLGGRDLDMAIFRHMCREIKANYKLDVTSNKKASIRLLQECEKLKKLMSANSTQIPLNIECFMEDKDISLRMPSI
ncbi:Heat shock 70 kDa protein 4L, partial [Cichlidogyrus casuarinus]